MKRVLIIILIVLLSISVSAITISKNKIPTSPIRYATGINNGLIAYWSFDVDGRDDFDGDDGASVVAAQHRLTGVINGSYYFAGSSNYIRIDSSHMRTNNDFTLSGWFKLDSPTETGSFFSVRDPLSNHPINWDIYWSLADSKVHADVTCNSGPLDYSTSSRIISDNDWHHVVLVRGQYSEMKLYVDSVLENSVTTTTSLCSIMPPGIDAYFGTDERDSHDLKGFLDEWRLYNRTLNQSEITTLYQQNSTITPGLCGDVNSDTRVDILDALQVARYSSGLILFTPNQIACGDVNYMTTPRVDILDALLIARYSSGQPVTLTCSSSC